MANNFYKLFIPSKLEINQGFILTSFEYVSTQCDLVIFDRQSTPLLKSNTIQRFERSRDRQTSNSSNAGKADPQR